MNVKGILAVAGLVLGLSLGLDQPASAVEADNYYQCSSTSASGTVTTSWCPVTQSYPLPVGSSGSITLPSSTLTSGTALSASNGQIIASSTTAGSIVVPSIAIGNPAGGAIWPKALLFTSATSGYAGLTAQIDLWSAAPTFTNGDGGTYAVATGSANFLGSLTCTFGAVAGSANLGQAGDGAYAECVPNQGQVVIPKLASGSAVYWSLLSTSTMTKASGATFTLKVPGLN